MGDLVGAIEMSATFPQPSRFLVVATFKKAHKSNGHVIRIRWLVLGHDAPTDIARSATPVKSPYGRTDGKTIILGLRLIAGVTRGSRTPPTLTGLSLA